MCDGEGRTTTSLERLLLAIEAFVTAPPESVTPPQLGEHLIRLRHGIDRLELDFARAAASFAATSEYETQGSTSAVDWVRHQCAMSGQAAARSIATGEAAERLPASVAALEAGRIGFAHLSLLAGTARALDGAAGDAGFDEAPLLKLALEHSVSRFGFDCTHARHAADAAAVLAEHVSAVEGRRLEFHRCGDGRIAVHALLDPVGGAIVRLALAPLAAPSGPDDERPLPRRRGDALVEFASHALEHGFLSEGRIRQRPQLQLTASVETVQGLAGAPGGELEFAGVVPAATVQRLACDASIRRILLDPESAVIDVGRALRVPSPAARAALRVRDQGCVWPGCDRPASWCSAHHVLHWGHGGDTDLDNLVLICHRHHWSVHEGGWRLVRTEQHRVLAVPPAPPSGAWPRAPDVVVV
jgi:hypothetical protein